MHFKKQAGHIRSKEYGLLACYLTAEPRNRAIPHDLGAVQKLFVQNAQDEFVSARRRREACRGTLTDDNAAMADSDKHYV